MLHLHISQIPPRDIMDATRISDDEVVILKRVHQDSEELKITRYLSSETLRADKRNHCVPLLDVLDPEEENYVFIVEPCFRIYDSPGLESMKDAMVFAEQVLEVYLALASQII